MKAVSLASTLALTLTMVGCAKKKDSPPPEPSVESPAQPKEKSETDTGAPTEPDSAKERDRGDFRPRYNQTENRELEKAFREAKLLEELATELNSILSLPRDIGIELGDCDEPNAYYDPDEHRILVCYQLIEMFDQNFAKFIDDDEQVVEATMGATMFTLFHELGHALVHELDLPITGKEEDAVDQLASVVLIAGGKDGAMMALDGADSFVGQADDSALEDLPFWGEHSLDEQRFYNIVCLVYGSDPDAHDELVSSGDLPEERAERCPDEYAQIARAWERLLAPHLL